MLPSSKPLRDMFLEEQFDSCAHKTPSTIPLTLQYEGCELGGVGRIK